MSALSETRQDVAGVLTDAGLNAVYTTPDRVTPPVAVVRPGSPYVEEGDTFKDWLVRLTITVITASATNETAMNSLDDSICEAIEAVRADQWSCTVGEPYALLIGTAEYPACDITITNWIEF